MSINFDENIVGIWYCQLADEFDVMCALQRDPAGGYKVIGRTRYYHSDDPWDENDSKRWFEGRVQADTDALAVERHRASMIDITSTFFGMFKPRYTPKLYELVRGERTVDEFGKLLQSMPWAHSMQVTQH